MKSPIKKYKPRTEKLTELDGKSGIVLDSSISDADQTISEIRKFVDNINIHVAQSVEEFTSRLKRNQKIDFVIAEYETNKLNIIEVVSICKSYAKIIPVILLTKYLDEHQAATYLNSGICAYLLKNRLNTLPFILNAYLSKIKSFELSHLTSPKSEITENDNFPLIENLSMGIYRLNYEGDCIYMNNKCREFTGLSKKYVQGKNFWDTIHPDDRERLLKTYSANIDSGEIRQIKFRFKKPDGEIVWVAGISQPEKDQNGNIIGRFGTLTNITEREKLDTKLQNVTDVLEQIDNIATINDKNDKILWVNKGFEKVTGYKAHEVINKTPAEFLRGKASSAEAINTINKNRSSGHPFTVEIVNYTKQGKPLWFLLSITPILDTEGEVVNYISIATDITQSVRKRHELEKQVSQRTEELVNVNRQLKDVNSNFSDSIAYAQHIQRGVLPDIRILKSAFKDSFVFLKPRDVISGDFYWFHPVREGMVIVAADCTGHGVPGAFISLIGINLLNKYVADSGIRHPSYILESLDDGLTKLLGMDGKRKITDGMDISVCTIDKKRKTFHYAGAGSPMVLIADNQLFYKKGSHFGLGNQIDNTKKQFDTFTFKYCAGDMIYLFSDGFVDQFGGPYGKKLMRKRFNQILLDIHNLPAHKQRTELNHQLSKWMNKESQVDDILTIGVRLE